MTGKKKEVCRDYAILDVFTTRPFSGNPLAVVHDGSGLSGRQMQTITREFNLSETIFILPPDNPNHSARVRIFTPGKEVDFAGHPTIGVAIELARRAWSGKGECNQLLMIEENIGLVRCGVKITPSEDGDAARGLMVAEFDIPKMPEQTAMLLDKKRIAAALDLKAKYIGFGHHEPAVWSAGVPFTFVPIATKAALAQARVRTELWEDAFGEYPNVYIYTPEIDRPHHDYHVRMFAPAFGIAEDPATGAAAVAFAGVVAQNEPLSDGENRFIIEQGYEMGRPSQIHLMIELLNSSLTRVSLSGHAVKIASGRLEVEV